MSTLATAVHTSTRDRVDWIDFAKGAGILLVVFGHAWRGAANAGLAVDPAVFAAVDRAVYLFHMPLFFVLAGLTLAQALRGRSLGAFVTARAVQLLYPLLLWSYLTAFARVAADHATNRDPLTLSQVLLYPVGADDIYWFLWALFLIQIACAALLRLVTVAESRKAMIPPRRGGRVEAELRTGVGTPGRSSPPRFGFADSALPSGEGKAVSYAERFRKGRGFPARPSGRGGSLPGSAWTLLLLLAAVAALAADAAWQPIPFVGTAVHYAPYLILGYLLRDHARAEASPVLALGGLLAFAGAASLAVVAPGLSGGTTGTLLAGVAVIGAAASLKSVHRVAGATGIGRVLGALGRISMPVYLAHVICLGAARVLLLRLGIDGFAAQVALGTGVATFAPVVLSRLAARWGGTALLGFAPFRPGTRRTARPVAEAGATA